MKAGDRITKLNGTPVWTFGDLQYRYDKTDRRADRLQISVDRAGEMLDLALALPVRWWWTDLRFRQSSVDPRLYFEDRPLSEEEKRKHGLKPQGFASEVKYVADFARQMKSHDLQIGDIIVAVDGVEQDELAHTAELYMKLRKKPEESVTLDVLRAGKRIQMPLRTYRMSFRK
jgi:S1-C subfamily serine protease